MKINMYTDFDNLEYKWFIYIAWMNTDIIVSHEDFWVNMILIKKSAY